MVLVESETTKDPAIEDLQKQINDIVQELNLLKEQQALQTGKTEILRCGSYLKLATQHK